MSASEAFDNLTTLVSQATSPSLQLQSESWKRVNPKWSMVVRVFVNMLTNEEVIPRLAAARTVVDLKAVLFVDHYLARVRNIHFKRHIRELLANTQVPLETIETYAALSFAREAIWQEEGLSSIDKHELLYSVEAAAAQLNMEPEALYRNILADEVNAELYICRTEIEKLLSQEVRSG